MFFYQSPLFPAHQKLMEQAQVIALEPEFIVPQDAV
jgi:hypothetical protein